MRTYTQVSKTLIHIKYNKITPNKVKIQSVGHPPCRAMLPYKKKKKENGTEQSTEGKICFMLTEEDPSNSNLNVTIKDNNDSCSMSN